MKLFLVKYYFGNQLTIARRIVTDSKESALNLAKESDTDEITFADHNDTLFNFKKESIIAYSVE